MSTGEIVLLLGLGVGALMGVTAVCLIVLDYILEKGRKIN